MKPDTDIQPHQNINRLIPKIWARIDEDIKQSFGLKYAHFAANNNQDEKKLAKQFLQIVNGERYIPDQLRAVEIDNTIHKVLSAHRGFNNFYSEPPFARELVRILGEPMKIPKIIEKKLVYSIVETFLTNGNGVAVNADDIYVEILSSLHAHQAIITALSFTEPRILSSLQFRISERKFREMLEIVKPSITSPPFNYIINYIENNYKGQLQHLLNDKTVKTSLESLRTLLK